MRGLRRTHTILASELTSNEDGDAPQLGALLGQIPGLLASVIADGAYDGEPTYCAVTERQPEPPVAVIIPPRSTAVPSAVAGTSSAGQRDQHIDIERRAGSLFLRLCQPLRRQTRHKSRGADRGGACWRFTMALSLVLGEEHLVADQMDTKADVTLEKQDEGFAITAST